MRVSELIKLIYAVMLMSLVSGCSMPKHSNTLIFATNTQFAVNAAYDSATQQPEINIGFKRQELVWLPLIVNKAAMVQKDESTDSIKCDKLFQAEDENKTKDAYSVIASFGTKHAASYEPGRGPVVNGEISQFIATGRAAVYLAKQGGDRLVSTSSATVAAADAEVAAAKKQRDEIDAKLSNLLDKLCSAEKNDLIQARVDGFLSKRTEYKDVFEGRTNKSQILELFRTTAYIGRKADFMKSLSDYTPEK